MGALSPDGSQWFVDRTSLNLRRDIAIIVARRVYYGVQISSSVSKCRRLKCKLKFEFRTNRGVRGNFGFGGKWILITPLPPHLRPNLRNTFNGRHLCGCWAWCIDNKMLSYRRETALQGALQFSPKVEDWNWETIFYGHNRSIFNRCDIIGLKICRIPWKNAK